MTTNLHVLAEDYLLLFPTEVIVRASSFGFPIVALFALGWWFGLESKGDFDPKGTIVVKVDARETARRLYHVKMTIPVKPGPLTLHYPKWIPGDHGPTGPVNDLAALQLRAGTESVPWTRDFEDMFTFHCLIPKGGETLDVEFDYLGSVPGGGQSWPVSASPFLVVLDWNPLVLYPSGIATDEVRVEAHLKLPKGWRQGTALPLKSTEADESVFETVSLTTLIDSPVLAGAHFKTIDIAPHDKMRHFLDLAADSPEALNMAPRTIEGYRNLVEETHSLFGSRHYRQYHFLVALSDPIAHFGLEHHESSVNRLPELSLIDPGYLRTTSSLLPHEMVHSWNGKHRRPRNLATLDYQKPMVGELLWVYEGLTTYLGRILPARSGLWTPDEFRSHLAVVAADASLQHGRTWRPLADTTAGASQLYKAGEAWTYRRRSTDASFYDEGELLWLEVDAMIREGTGGKRSFDDVCKAFYKKPDGEPSVRPYDLDDLLAILKATHNHDWKSFFESRVNTPRKSDPFEGIERSGWRLVYQNTPTTMVADIERTGKWGFNTGGINLAYSLGLFLKADGTVQDVVVDSPADRAGMAPGMKLIGVDGRKFSEARIRDWLHARREPGSKLGLLAEEGDFYKAFEIDYNGGERFPTLERIEGKPDLLSEILKPTR